MFVREVQKKETLSETYRFRNFTLGGTYKYHPVFKEAAFLF
jgi:hypothetical protein